MQNESCPITLEPLVEKTPGEVFVHMEFGFDMVALYEYLVTAPTLVNPMNRAPFCIEDLERLEAQMEAAFGEDCILHDLHQEEEEEDNDVEDDLEDGDGDDDDNMVSGSDTATNMHMMHLNEDDRTTIDWLDDTELISRLNTSIMDIATESNDRIIRLRVDIDMHDVVRDAAAAAERGARDAIGLGPNVPPLPTVEEEGEKDVEGDDDEFMDIATNALPPRRTFPSITDMFRDPGRQVRMSDRLSLLQYLEYDAMAILVHMLDMAYDNHFHRFVWQHTSLDVIDTVTTYLNQGTEDAEHETDAFTSITEPSPNLSSAADYDLEVVYTECWEVYRHAILNNLERRYAETAQDILNISRNDFQVLFACHRAHVRERAVEQDVNYDGILETLQKIENELRP